MGKENKSKDIKFVVFNVDIVDDRHYILYGLNIKTFKKCTFNLMYAGGLYTLNRMIHAISKHEILRLSEVYKW